jgi:hypothetical protein
MINECGAFRGMRISRGTEVLGEIPAQYHCVHHPGSNPGCQGRSLEANQLNYGMALINS